MYLIRILYTGFHGTLKKSMLGIWEPILDLWESFLALKGKCKILRFYFMPIRVNYGSLGVKFLDYCESTGGLWESISNLYESIMNLWGSIFVLWELISGFGNQVRPQEVDDGHLVIDFRPLGVLFGLYRILKMIHIENLIREFTNKNQCLL